MTDSELAALWIQLVDALDPDTLGDAIDKAAALPADDLADFLAIAAGVSLGWRIRAEAGEKDVSSRAESIARAFEVPPKLIGADDTDPATTNTYDPGEPEAE